MSERENEFLAQLKRWIIGGVTAATTVLISSMVIFYINANGRIEVIEKTQKQKVDVFEFNHYKQYQELKDSYIYESMEELKIDIKELKVSI